VFFIYRKSYSKLGANKKLFILLIIFYFNLNYGQIGVINRKPIISKIHYSIQNDEKKQTEGFVFPPVYEEDSIVTNASIPHLKKIKDQDIKFPSDLKLYHFWSKDFNQPISIKLDSTYIYLRHYLENVQNLVLLFQTTENKLLKLSFEVKYSKYQIPIDNILSECENISDTMQIKSEVKISKLYIGINKKIKNNKYHFAIADLKIFSYKNISTEVNNPFYDGLTGNFYAEKIIYNSLKIPSSNICCIVSFPTYCSYSEGQNTKILVEDTSKYGHMMANIKFLSHVFNKYPFYKEKDINKDSVLSHFNKIVKDSLDNEKFIDSIRLLIKKFNDPHFFIHDNSLRRKEKYKYPVVPYLFGNKLFIVGVFDTTLLKKVKPGMIITTINKQNVCLLVDSLKSSGIDITSDNAKNILYFISNNDSIELELTNIDTVNDNKCRLKIGLTDRLIIPQNFVPKHAEFKLYNKNIGYFKLNSFNSGDFMQFINHYETLKKLSAIIFDLRNNPGGKQNEALRILSCFINDNEIYSHDFFPYENDNDLIETTVIKPNKYFDLSHLRIIVLINEKTACAGEMFSYFTQKKLNGIVIGNSNSSGTYIHTQSIEMPSGHMINIDCLYKIYTFDHTVIEGVGIKPNIYVTLNTVTDLYPYNDKILQTALRFLNKDQF